MAGFCRYSDATASHSLSDDGYLEAIFGIFPCCIEYYVSNDNVLQSVEE